MLWMFAAVYLTLTASKSLFKSLRPCISFASLWIYAVVQLHKSHITTVFTTSPFHLHVPLSWALQMFLPFTAWYWVLVCVILFTILYTGYPVWIYLNLQNGGRQLVCDLGLLTFCTWLPCASDTLTKTTIMSSSWNINPPSVLILSD